MVVLKIGLRNLISHKLKSVIVGLIIILGTFLAIIGSSFVASVSESMKKSIINSVAGDIQIYSEDARDRLLLFGGGTDLPGSSNISFIPDFKKVKTSLSSKIDNIKHIVPMGINSAMVPPGNILDIRLEELRNAVKENDGARIKALKDHIASIINSVKRDFWKTIIGTEDIAEDEINARIKQIEPHLPDELKTKSHNIERALSEEFWFEFDKEPFESLEFLENKVAPLIWEDTMLILTYIGTIPDEFQEAFDLFEIVKGNPIPEGKRGFLFNDWVYENQVKHKIASRLDQIKRAIEEDNKTIGSDRELQSKIRFNIKEVREIAHQMGSISIKELTPHLQKLLKNDENDIIGLLKDFLKMNDENFMERYAFFYDHIAHEIILYKIKIGDVFPITSFTKTGSSSSVNMKVYGTFSFKSLEKSPLAGNFNLMDIMSFRDLYGFMTPEQIEEAVHLEKEMGIFKELGRDDIEALLGEQLWVEEEIGDIGFDEIFSDESSEDLDRYEMRRRIFDKTYTKDEMENGACLNAAILLKDPAEILKTMEEIRKISREDSFNLKVTGWQKASGRFGQFIFVVKAILYAALFFIFIVAIVIMMNSMVMAAMGRVKEIGTMRAIGAQKRYVFMLFLVETLILSIISVFIGSVSGIICVQVFNRIGIPAFSDFFYFLFAGPRLYAFVKAGHIISAFALMIIISIVATLYPAYIAAKVTPIEAIEKE